MYQYLMDFPANADKNQLEMIQIFHIFVAIFTVIRLYILLSKFKIYKMLHGDPPEIFSMTAKKQSIIMRAMEDI